MAFDLHRHSEFSSFDGYGKATELAQLAKELGYNALSVTDHGNTNGLIQTYNACKDVGIKPILGVEGYMLPKHKPSTRGYHMILIAKNLKGYGNMNRIQFEGDKQKFYNPIWDFDILRKYHEGLICTTACVAGYLAQAILKDNLGAAERFLKELKGIFGPDLYIEVQPYKISDPGMQEKVNVASIKLGKKLGIPLILTSDSHRGRKEELPSYIKMHEIAGHDISHIKETYAERYMPIPGELEKRFIEMHSKDFGEAKCKALAKEMMANLDKIESQVEGDYLERLELKLPKLHEGAESKKILINKVKKGLKRRNKYKPEYIARCKEELDVIVYHGFEDYFLIVADYVNWAKAQGIVVGPGRGSVCNCLVAYALAITEVDSLMFNLDFRRFLRKDKARFPDIDLDFETSRRHEVIEYLCKKYEGHAARISSYGLYKIENLMNDLCKVCGLPFDKDVDPDVARQNKQTIKEMKKFVNICVDELGNIDTKHLLESEMGKQYNKKYDNVLVHFTHLFKKVRFIGTHAAGVAITGGDLLDYVALKTDKNGDVYTSYDLSDIDAIHVIKFDILGLKTMESIGDLRKATGVTVNYDEAVHDKKVIEYFEQGKCDGIFQFEKGTARRILNDIHTDCFDDVVAASAMNRPGPLSLKMPEQYAYNKTNIAEAKRVKWYDYTKSTYGTIIYQEQVQQIAINIGGTSWADADQIMKMMKGHSLTEAAVKKYNEMHDDLLGKFTKGATQKGFTKKEAEELFDNMTAYTFNQGHALGYSLISVEEMFYKVYYPNEYWFAKLKYAKDDEQYNIFCEKAVADGAIIFLPHVNYSKQKTTLRKVEGENCLQQGLAEIKNVGDKAAQQIVDERKAHGIFRSFDDFYDRCKSRLVTTRVIDALVESGAVEFSKKTYISRVTKYNSSLYSRAMR